MPRLLPTSAPTPTPTAARAPAAPAAPASLSTLPAADGDRPACGRRHSTRLATTRLATTLVMHARSGAARAA